MKRDVRQNNSRTLMEGFAAGVIGTIPMTLSIMVAKWGGLIVMPPPRQISDNVAEQAPPLPEQGEPAFGPAWILAHFAYGGICGAIYAGLSRFLPRRTLQAGSLFGSGVWLVSYGGYLPAIHLYPPPDEDSRTRTTVMIVAHLVFGTSVAAVHSRMKSRT